MASGRKLLGDWTAKNLKVWLYNLEDTRDVSLWTQDENALFAPPSTLVRASRSLSRNWTLWPKRSKLGKLTFW